MSEKNPFPPRRNKNVRLNFHFHFATHYGQIKSIRIPSGLKSLNILSFDCLSWLMHPLLGALVLEMWAYWTSFTFVHITTTIKFLFFLRSRHAVAHMYASFKSEATALCIIATQTRYIIEDIGYYCKCPVKFEKFYFNLLIIYSVLFTTKLDQLERTWTNRAHRIWVKTCRLMECTGVPTIPVKDRPGVVEAFCRYELYVKIHFSSSYITKVVYQCLFLCNNSDAALIQIREKVDEFAALKVRPPEQLDQKSACRRLRSALNKASKTIMWIGKILIDVQTYSATVILT